jgi:hypothetical protein
MKGWVYVITNPSMPNVLKVGCSKNDPKLRAEQFNTGAPDDYIVEYDALVDHPTKVEKEAHALLQDYGKKKEWFNCDIHVAVSAIRQAANYSVMHEFFKQREEIEFETKFTEGLGAIEILPHLKKCYPHYLRLDITSVKFCQVENKCYLEVVSYEIEGWPHDEIIKRTNLGFIRSNGGLFFDPENSISENVTKFINDFDEIGIINCTDLFTEESARMLDEYWSQYGVCPDPKIRIL